MNWKPITIALIILFILYFAGNAIGHMLVSLGDGLIALGNELEKIPAR